MRVSIQQGVAQAVLQGYAQQPERLTAQGWASIYQRLLGAPGGASGEVQPNREFNDLWLRFVSSVSQLGRQGSLQALLTVHGGAEPAGGVDDDLVQACDIGETERSLSQLFARAQLSNWVLLFDETDALFGKRSEVKDSPDRYANLEVAHLLLQIENYEGLATLTSNTRSNIDPDATCA